MRRFLTILLLLLAGLAYGQVSREAPFFLAQRIAAPASYAGFIWTPTNEVADINEGAGENLTWPQYTNTFTDLQVTNVTTAYKTITNLYNLWSCSNLMTLWMQGSTIPNLNAAGVYNLNGYFQANGSDMVAMNWGDLTNVVGEFSCDSTPLVTAVLTNLVWAGSLDLGVNLAMQSLVLTDFKGTTTGVFQFIGANLTNPSLPAVEYVAGNFDASTCTNLTSLAMPSMTNFAGNFDVSGDVLLTSVNVGSAKFTDGKTIDASGCALTATTVNHILARAAASTLTTATIDLSGGNNACPTGQGLTDYASLTNNGNTVTVVWCGGSAYTESLYLRADATGANDGTNWTDAWTNFNAISWGTGTGSLGSNDVLWVAGGSYSGFDFGAANTTVKRARSTNTECSSATGWSAGYDAQVLFNAANASGDFIGSDYDNVTFDGQIDSGIKIYNLGTSQSDATTVYALRMRESGQTLRYIEVDGGFDHPAARYGFGGPPDNNDGNENNYTISHCKIHAATVCIIVSHMDNLIVEHCDLSDTPVNGTYHSDVIYIDKCKPCTVRYNRIHDIQSGTQVIYFCSAYGDADNTDYGYVYGNIFDSFEVWENATSAAIVFDNQQVADGTEYGSHFYVYNNTFVDLKAEAVTVYTGEVPSGGCRFTNNILHNVNTNSYSVGGSVVADYNFYSGTYHTQGGSEANGQDFGTNNAFVSYATDDYHLATNTAAGVTLSSPFTTDPDGVTRGGDSTWDRGAYEYVTP